MGCEAAAWVVLRSAAGIGDVLGRTLAERLGGARQAVAAPPDALIAAGCPVAAAQSLADPATHATAHREIARIAAVEARLVALDDPEYPPALRQLHDAPLYLIARGTPMDDRPAVAIVGARRATSYGTETARLFAEGLAAAGVTVVSGLARGIDGAAHEGTLAARGRTIAVLGSGIDVIYPAEHAGLAGRIVETGTLLSERPVGAAPVASHFPARNRILAAMTQGTIVIEAAERSGSLITARLANECGREVFAVPGRIDSPLSFGAHLLIRDGATLVRDVDDVLEQIAPALAGAGRAGSSGEKADSGVIALIELLRNEPRAVDDLIRESRLSADKILATMLDLELRGVVRKVGGRLFQLTGRFAGVGGLQ